MPMEVVIAIGILCIVFLVSTIALIYVIVYRYCQRARSLDFFKKHFTESRPDVHLINGSIHANNMELDDVRFHPDIDKILADARWVDDATGLIPHCLAILKSCHQLTERLIAATMSSLPRYDQENQQRKLWEIIEVAQKISPRVDDVVQSMYPPLDPRLLEARCLALVLSVTHLALSIRFLCQVKSNWIEDSLSDLDNQMTASDLL